MRDSFFHVRRAALLAVLCTAAACGDDSEEPDRDANVDPVGENDAGDASADNRDASVSDAGVGDAGDASVTDAAVSDARDASVSDAGDAGRTELDQALDPTGVRIDARRAELVIGAFCDAYASCLAPPDAGADVSGCRASTTAAWQSAVEAEDSPACLDATLDAAGCIGRGGTCAEIAARCDAMSMSRDSVCMAGRD